MTRKTAETLGFLVFKIIARFLLVTAAFMQSDQAVARICIILLIAIDLALQANGAAAEANATAIKDSMWYHTLTHRIFYRDFYEKFQTGEYLDVDHLFQEATKSAVADIKQARADEDLTMQLSGFGFQKFGVAVWSFAGNIVTYGVGYGLPLYVASILKHSSLHLPVAIIG